MSLKDFTRERLLTFPHMVLFLINLAKKSLQVNLNEFFKLINLPSITKQAFSKARKKLSPHTFILLNNKLIEEFYTDNDYSTWNGYRLIAVDGSDIQLVQTEKIKENFGTAKNQLGPALGMAKISYAYDILNRLTINAQIDRCNTSERDLFIKHVEAYHSNAKDLYILDRGYPSWGMLVYLSAKKKDFLIRCTLSSCFSKVNEVLISNRDDAIVRLYPTRMKKEQVLEIKKRFPEIDLKRFHIDVRVIVLTLKTGEKELLITSLLNQEEYLKDVFAKLYFQRWGIEENYKWHKRALELENFSGQSKLSIEQDFFSLVFTANITSLLIREAEEEMEEEHKKKDFKHIYRVNKRLAIASIRDELIENLLSKHASVDAFCDRLKRQIKKSLCPVRPGRSFKRIKKGRLKYSSSYRMCL
jgi:Transposase DDE domain